MVPSEVTPFSWCMQMTNPLTAFQGSHTKTESWLSQCCSAEASLAPIYKETENKCNGPT